MEKLLFIWYKRSKGILEGGGQCSLRNYKMLCELLGEEQIDSYYIHDEYQKKSLCSYAQGIALFPFHYFYGLTPKRVEEIVLLAQAYDYIFIDRSVFGIIAKALKEAKYPGKVITHFHNVETIYFDAVTPKYLPGRRILLNAVDKNDAYACQYSDEIIVLNQRDELILRKKYPSVGHTTRIPIALPDRGESIQQTTELTRKQPTCLFLGSYFAPNNQGILWFVEHVLPYVDIHMKIVGRGMSKLKEESPALRDIEVVSDAPDLLPHLQDADIVVLPIFSGSGMKVKTCESLMYGKNIIGTPEAFEGYDIDYSLVGGNCKTAQEFIECIKNFTQNPRPRFNEYARRTYLQKYSLDAIKQSFKTII